VNSVKLRKRGGGVEAEKDVFKKEKKKKKNNKRIKEGYRETETSREGVCGGKKLVK